MICKKAAGQSGIVAETLKAAGEEGVELTETTDRGCFQLRCFSHQTVSRASL